MDLRRGFSNISKYAHQYLKEIDFPLFATTVAISFLSVLNIYGIVGAESILFKKQLIFVIIGIVCMVVGSFFNYRYLKNYSLPVMVFYAIVLILLIITLFSSPVRGIHAWIALGNLTFEPSELMKLGLVILLAKYFSQRHFHINHFRHIIISGIYCAIPALVIFIQPDLGSAAILALLWFSILIAAGINLRHLSILLLVGLICMSIGWAFILRPYQKDRIISFLNPYSDPTGIGYNAIQSKIAIGSGGWFGNGLGEGSQATLGFLPEPYNDFALASFVEQFGFVGTSAFFGGLLFFISRIFLIGQRSQNNFSKFFSLGIGIVISSHVLISSAVNTGLMPITGLPFTFLSYGGSHLISMMIGLGILQSIKRYG